ncbi:uncharacterized protein LOC132563165 [Ylistrum balloti]|uniref:uncharacterized protein LOC132563165 n=1 Tax=Ylistrum balloti TaxID=509963 RepID=UPI0029059919|nr:uncharacterized protein LOC132563165 [Ylistrum balloti]
MHNCPLDEFNNQAESCKHVHGEYSRISTITMMQPFCMTLLCMVSLWCVVQAIKIQTYNVGFISFIDNYEERKENAIRALRSGDYDVMCLQEMWYGDDIDRLKKKLGKSITVYTPPLYQERMFGGFLKAPPCHNAPITAACIALKCADLANNYAALANCTVECGLMSESQGCITCLSVSSWTPLRCFNYWKGESINIPGVVLLSKRKVTSVKTVFFEPNVKQLSRRAYIEAEIEDVGTVFCSHSTSNANTEYYEPQLRHLYSSLAEQNLADSRKLIEAALQADKPVIMGDLNTGPEIPANNITNEFEDSYNEFLSQGFQSPYVTMVGKCTFCRKNPLVEDWEYDEVLDHVLVRNHTVLGAKRIYDQNIPGKDFPMSDHYGVEVEVGN